MGLWLSGFFCALLGHGHAGLRLHACGPPGRGERMCAFQGGGGGRAFATLPFAVTLTRTLFQVTGMALCHSGNRLITCAGDNLLRVWALAYSPVRCSSRVAVDPADVAFGWTRWQRYSGPSEGSASNAEHATIEEDAQQAAQPIAAEVGCPPPIQPTPILSCPPPCLPALTHRGRCMGFSRSCTAPWPAPPVVEP